jgi:mRNA interferase HigB
MRVITVRHFRDFCRKHPRAKQALLAWEEEARAASWKTPQDIKAHFGTASFLPNKRVVFNIKGNEYRLVVSVAYAFQAIYIEFIGTHADYDAIDPQTVEMR